MNKFGKLYVFEGPDGVGKTSLARGLENYIKSKGIDCEYYAFPGKREGTLGYHIYQLHHDLPGFNICSVHPASLQLLHIASHIDAIENYILPTLRSGRSIVLDRYWWSTKVYGLVDGVATTSLEAMIKVELAHWNNLYPTIAFLITRPMPLRQDVTFDDKWRAYNTTYLEVAQHQQTLYPVEAICNDRTEQTALDQIIERIAI